jgi:hypothetical protein
MGGDEEVGNACLRFSPRALPSPTLDDLDSYLMRTMTTDHAPFQINPGLRFSDPRQVWPARYSDHFIDTAERAN